MKNNPWNHIDKYRASNGILASRRGDRFGYFLIPGPCAKNLKVIASNAELDQRYPWDHVSVSCENRCPNWPEINFIKDLFFDADECAFQFHPPKDEYINNHPYCLHLWKPSGIKIPLPPAIMVGLR